jgi:hypothetical protein
MWGAILASNERHCRHLVNSFDTIDGIERYKNRLKLQLLEKNFLF